MIQKGIKTRGRSRKKSVLLCNRAIPFRTGFHDRTPALPPPPVLPHHELSNPPPPMLIISEGGISDQQTLAFCSFRRG